jgi:hypothetical protein
MISWQVFIGVFKAITGLIFGNFMNSPAIIHSVACRLPNQYLDTCRIVSVTYLAN